MQHAQVELELSFFPLMWTLYFVTPRVSVDGNEWTHDWGNTSFLVAPGRHQICAWYPHMFGTQASMGHIILDAVAGATYKLRYRPSWLFLPGSIKLVGQSMLPPQTAG